jgi:hypothetical protein
MNKGTHPLSAMQQRFHKMTSDEPPRTGNQYFIHTSFLFKGFN